MIRVRMKRVAKILASVALAWAASAGPALAQEQPRGSDSTVADAQEQPRQIRVTILGMSCPFCAYGVEQKMKKLEGVKDLEIELKSGITTITLEQGADLSNERLEKTVKDAGFEVAKITRNFESEYPDVGAESKSQARSG